MRRRRTVRQSSPRATAARASSTATQARSIGRWSGRMTRSPGVARTRTKAARRTPWSSRPVRSAPRAWPPRAPRRRARGRLRPRRRGQRQRSQRQHRPQCQRPQQHLPQQELQRQRCPQRCGPHRRQRGGRFRPLLHGLLIEILCGRQRIPQGIQLGTLRFGSQSQISQRALQMGRIGLSHPWERRSRRSRQTRPRRPPRPRHRRSRQNP
mmetsp:Transcript_56261/g.155752  ORF Transcript_56261/g.155752 Transcript_56261/m.155752 type:complete len:210 (-) Transcript_56261:379-1008(-)